MLPWSLPIVPVLTTLDCRWSIVNFKNEMAVARRCSAVYAEIALYHHNNNSAHDKRYLVDDTRYTVYDKRQIVDVHCVGGVLVSCPNPMDAFGVSFHWIPLGALAHRHWPICVNADRS